MARFFGEEDNTFCCIRIINSAHVQEARVVTFTSTNVRRDILNTIGRT